MAFENMKPNVEEPVTVETGGDRATVTRHPAFGQIEVVKVSGLTSLYGSDFQHQSYVAITIKHSELHRSLSYERQYDRGEIVRIEMSEAQWATFVSAFGIGGGVPCTLSRLNGQSVPRLPPPVDVTAKYQADADKELKAAMDSLVDLRQSLQDESLKLSKVAREGLLAKLRVTERKFNDSLPFIAESLSEHMETTVEKAKTEVHAYMGNAIRAAGLQALGVTPPLAIAAPKNETEGGEG